MAETKVLNVAQGFEYPEILEETRERWNATPTEALLSRVEKLDSENGSVMLGAYPEGTQSIDEALERSGGEAVINDLPFANGAWPWTRLTAKWLADVTGKPAFSMTAPGSDGSKFNFSPEEKQLIKDGDFGPYVRRGHEHLASDFPKTGKVSTVGASQGGTASIARADYAARDFEVVSAAAFDPPTAAKRNPAELFRDLTKASYGDIEAELREAGIAAFLEAFGYEGPKRSNNFLRTAHYAGSIASRPATGLLIARGLGRPTLAPAMTRLLNAGVDVALANGSESAIMTPEMRYNTVVDVISGAGSLAAGKLTLVTFEGSNHAGSDNKMKFGLVALAAARPSSEA